ncbi:SDR family oxidoreductase [Microbispora catharanthi]|uniref:SDR family NAD(P)-dependent oxidoreductase n=1 Tax=Microbispora catharanthi TaxID=1712871 RepID=A0A5N6C4S9_9ACTN|nr:SDR family oxidoreductase [Microbispora catharanthi]KAB8187751.1 SDR family NAD(P)-dependent oxidoreductase [Microbispora catharanthi]
MNRFEGVRVLLTGAASGIGRATAVRLAAEGAHVFGVDRDERGLAETGELVKGPYVPHVADVTDERAVVAAVDAAAAASKGAVLAFSLSLAAEVVGRGIRVVPISPGTVATPLTRDIEFPEGWTCGTSGGSARCSAPPPLSRSRPPRTADISRVRTSGSTAAPEPDAPLRQGATT